MKVAQELKEAHIPWQGGFAETPKHSQIGLQQRKEALRPILMHVPTGIFLPCVIDEFVHIALHRPVAAGRVCIEPTARVAGEVCSLLNVLHSEIFVRLDDARPLATDPGDERRTVFIVVPPTGLAFRAAPTRSATQLS